MLQDEALPGIPFRLNPKPEGSQRLAKDGQTPILMVDVATSPIMPFDDDPNLGPSRTASPAPSTARSVTFLTEPEVTSRSVKTADFAQTKTVSLVVKKTSQGTNMRSLATTVSLSERPRRKSPPKRVRECSKISLYPRGNGPTAESAPEPPPSESHVMERLPRLSDTARSNQTLLNSSRKSASMSDLTDVGSIFSWHDKEFEARTARSIDMNSDNVGPTSYFQRNKSKSLLDLLKPSSKGGGEDGKPSDLSAYHKRQRIAQLAFRRESTLRRSSTLSSSDADKEWLDMVNTQVIDKADYNKYASRRKPTTPSEKKRSNSYCPKSGTDFRLSHPANGKVYPVFFNDGSPMRKFGRALYKRRLSKSKE